MRNFTGETARQILTDEISVETLLKQYPEYKQEVLQEIHALKSSAKPDLIRAILDKYTFSAKVARNRINASRMNEQTVKAFVPDIIKARFAFYLLEQLNAIVSSKKTSTNTRLNLWDGTILQRLLFKKGFDRKPVSARFFPIYWRLIMNKKLLMPLVNQKGIYCFYSKELIKELSILIGDHSCVEIGAGDGTLTTFLKKHHVDCKATDDYSWNHYITYPDFVEKADAKTALHKYNPKVVICSWPAPKNTYEKHVFQSSSVDLYIVIGTKSATYTGDFDTYYSLKHFSMMQDERLSSLILPPSDENAVYVFRRLVK
ncbi:SAM-dependent methyltransferase [Paenibacillus timonensis]|nr:SAM-dependent methyltransferase [Paenibacillus timonensis]MUG86262.1 SAM-dependent methyltransferase [Paenibacillus timonensis]